LFVFSFLSINSIETMQNKYWIAQFVFLLLVFIPLGVFAQTNPTKVKGKIWDALSNRPLNNVNIECLPGNSGIVSDENAEFTIEVPGKDFSLRFTHIGYQPETRVFSTENPFPGFLNVYLSANSILLNEAVVTATKSQVCFKDKKFAVQDYSFWNENILLLTYMGNLRNQVLVLLDQTLDTICVHKNLPMQSKSLYLDCLDECHLLGSDEVLQLYFDAEKSEIGFFKPISIEAFHETMDNCLFRKNGYLVFEHSRYRDMLKEYIGVEMETRKQVRIAHVFDKDGMKGYSQYMDQIAMQYSMEKDAIETNSLEGNHSQRDMEVELAFAKQIAFRPVASSLFKTKEHVFLFDHLNDQIIKFDKDFKKLSSIPIQYHKSKYWAKTVFVDENPFLFYTIYQKNGVISLLKINPENGKENQVAIFEKHYPESIKIKNGYAYFMHRQASNVWDKKSLFRQRIN
jgi:CarboxypepD_reg-like domain